MPTTMLGVLIWRALTLYKDRMNVVDAKENRPLRKGNMIKTPIEDVLFSKRKLTRDRGSLNVCDQNLELIFDGNRRHQ